MSEIAMEWVQRGFLKRLIQLFAMGYTLWSGAEAPSVTTSHRQPHPTPLLNHDLTTTTHNRNHAHHHPPHPPPRNPAQDLPFPPSQPSLHPRRNRHHPIPHHHRSSNNLPRDPRATPRSLLTPLSSDSPRLASDQRRGCGCFI